MINYSRQLAFVTLGLLLIAGCKQAENQLHPDLGLPLGTGAGNLTFVEQVTPNNATLLADDNPTVTGIQATIVITFSDFMDRSSILPAVSVINATTGEPVQNLVTSYSDDARKLFVRHEAWTSNSSYLLCIATGGARNRWGRPLDGNRNGTAEPSPYDDYFTTFYTTGSTPDSCINIQPPRVTAVVPDTARITDTLPLVRITYSRPMDTLTLKPVNFRLLSNTGASVQLDSVTIVPTQATFRPRSPLRFGDTYRLVLIDTAIRARGLRNSPAHLLRLDTDNDGPEPTEPEWSSYFLCDTVPSPTVTVSPITGGRRFQFSVRMDTASLLPSRIRLFDNRGYVPGTFNYPFGCADGVLTLDYFYSRPVSGSVRAFVAKEISSTKGRMLDGQATPNGIGGEPWDDYWSP